MFFSAIVAGTVASVCCYYTGLVSSATIKVIDAGYKAYVKPKIKKKLKKDIEAEIDRQIEGGGNGNS